MSMLVERETSAWIGGSDRRATGDPAGRDAAGVPDPEVSEQAKRRRFTAEYKLRIVREADACKGDGDVAALLRREGLYSSQLSSWRRQRDEIAKVGMTSRKRGRKAKAEDPRVKELERENARLQRRLARVETMLDRKSALRREIPWILRGIPRASKAADLWAISKGPSFGTGRGPQPADPGLVLGALAEVAAPVCRSACLQVFGIAGLEFVCVFGHDGPNKNRRNRHFRGMKQRNLRWSHGFRQFNGA